MNGVFVTHSWVALAIAIVFGVLGTIFLKLSDGFRRLTPIVFLTLFYTISFIALTFAMKHIELSTVYAVWSGVGTTLVTLMGVLYFHESLSVKKMAFLLLIILGVIGIHLSDGIT